MDWIRIAPAVLLVIMATITIATTNCDGHSNCYGIGDILLETDIDDKTVTAIWQVNSTDQIYGFKVIIETSDETLIYESPILNKNAKSMVINADLDGQNIEVCVLVYHNMTEVIAKKCEEIEINNLQIYVGILAGVVFLIPCIAALSFIIYKDLQISKTPPHEQSEVRILIESEKDIETEPEDKRQRAKIVKFEGKDNSCFQNEIISKGNAGEIEETEAAAQGIDRNAHEDAGNKTTSNKDEVVKATTASVHQVEGHSNGAKIFVIRL